LLVKTDPVKGRSVYSAIFFKKDAFVCSYKGELIGAREARSREIQMPAEQGSFIFHFNFNGKKFAIDATKEPVSEQESCGRLINHSKSSENIVPKMIVINNDPQIVFVAKFDILLNHELFYDYNDFRSSSVVSFPFLRK